MELHLQCTLENNKLATRASCKCSNPSKSIARSQMSVPRSPWFVDHFEHAQNENRLLWRRKSVVLLSYKHIKINKQNIAARVSHDGQHQTLQPRFAHTRGKKILKFSLVLWTSTPKFLLVLLPNNAGLQGNITCHCIFFSCPSDIV